MMISLVSFMADGGLGKGSPVHCSPLLFTGKHLCISWKINKIASEKCMAPIFTYFPLYHPSYPGYLLSAQLGKGYAQQNLADLRRRNQTQW